MKKFLKIFFRLILFAIIAIIILLFAFPEILSRKTVKYFLPDIKYSVGNIAWRKYGVDVYDLNIIVPGATCDLHRLSLRFDKEKELQLFINADDGLIEYTQVSSEYKKEVSEKISGKYFSFDDIPVKLFFTAGNIDLKTSFGVNGNINAKIIAEGKLFDKKIKNLAVKINSLTDSIKISKELKAENIYGELNLLLKNPIDFNYKPNDIFLYYLNAFDGNFNCNAQTINAGEIEIENYFASANISSGKVNLSEMGMDVFEGKMIGTADVSRRKVKGKNKWLFKYNVNLCVTNINAMEFCDAFNLNKNKLGGRFSGCVKTSVFGKWVKLLDGKLQSDNPGTLYFPEAQKYMIGMQESMQK
ncbi:hypothetical protein KAH27_04175, partial [bacterium]|nr:hypothetical protein [bacterium]